MDDDKTSLTAEGSHPIQIKINKHYFLLCFKTWYLSTFEQFLEKTATK